MLESYAKLTPGAFYLFQSDDFGRYSLPAVSEQIKAILGFDAHTLCQNPQLLFERLHPDDRSRVHTFIQQSRHDLSSFHCEYRIQHQAGHWIWLAAHSEPELLDNKVTLWRGFLYDISSQKIAEQQLQQSNQSARALLDHLMDAVISIDAQGRILSFNRSAELLFGYQRHEAVGQNIRLLMPEAQAAQHDNHLARYQQGGKPSIVGSKRRLEAKHKDGRQFPIELRVAEMPHPDGKRFVGVLRDLSRQHRQDKVMQQLKQRDPLTQLPNRHAFLHTLSDVVKRRNSTPLQFALFLLNLDNFKQLNNATSHGFGDVALLEIARRLQQHFGSMYKLARLGGDEFAIIWPLLPAEHSPTLPELHTAVEQLQALIARPIAGAGYQCQLTACFGICMLAESMRPDQWLQSAEIALKAAKQQSCNSYQIYTEELATRDQLQGQLLFDLRHAIAQNELELYLQGQFDATGKLLGAEALLRWHHPKRGLIPPDTFIPLAEESGFIAEIGRWLIDQAGQLLACWQKNPVYQGLQLAINISSRQFSEPDFVEGLLQCQQYYGFAADKLHLELTESLLIDHATEVADVMMQLNNRGFTFSLDDFGTGYSSLAYLKRLPLQTLKIDRSFVRDLHDNPNDALIARSIVSLAHNLGLDVIAEGVETKSQLNALHDMGCTCFQGYFFQRPESIEAFTERYLEPVQPKLAFGSAG